MLLLFVCLSSNTWGKSLFSDESYVPLVSEKKAIHVGDLLTVIIYENATASASSDADANSGSQLGITASDGSTDIEGSLGLKNEFDGGGSINRQGQITAQVAAQVLAITDSGLLEIRGEQEIILNSELQKIRVNGFVRPEDISDSNAILSSRIANSKIEFIGEGILSDSEKPGWITRFFQWLF